MRSYWSREGPQSSMTGVLTERRNLGTDTHTRRMTCEHEGRGSTSQEASKIARKPPEARGEA